MNPYLARAISHFTVAIALFLILIFAPISRACASYPPSYYNCGNAFLKIYMDKGTAASGRRVFPLTWILHENWEKQDRENNLVTGQPSINFRCTKGDKCWFNGKLCRKINDEEGKEQFPDD